MSKITTLEAYLPGYKESLKNKKYIKVSFRKLVHLPSTTYATHGLYGYPAKFIPHVVRYVLTEYTEEGNWVFDPFAGYGTVAIECCLMNRNYIVWDLNPMLRIFVRASTYTGEIDTDFFAIDWDYPDKFIPNWKNITYWHPKEFLEQLSRAWAWYHEEVEQELKPLIAIPLLKVTKYFSYADLQVSKLYKSKKARERVESLLRSNWKELMKKMYTEEVKKVILKIKEYQSLHPVNVNGVVKAGVDALKERLTYKVDILLTSPPYLQAQEYIRSFKLELFWLGFSESEIRYLQKKEIPYNDPPAVKIKSKTYNMFREKITKMGHTKLLKLYDNYFRSLVYFLINNHDRIKKYICFFVGPVKVRNMRIPIDEILKEVLEDLGWKHEKTYIDVIKSRRLFKAGRNPATGLPDERTPTEHLLIMAGAK